MPRRPPSRRRIIRGYTDLTVIRTGPLWSLYRAVDVETSRQVVMRVVRAAVGPELLEDLAAETAAVQRLEAHPNIATPLRFLRRSDGSAVAVTELCRGSLEDRLASARPAPAVTVEEAVSIGRSVAAGLEAAHRGGLIHKGLKPSRVLMTRSAEPAIDGFGLASLRLAAGEANAPISAHTAPEVFEGRRLSPATDVYGLASTLHELISGRAPFRAAGSEAPAEMILRIVTSPAPRLQLPGVPVALADLLFASLSKDPAMRPSSAAEFAAGLRRAMPAPEEPTDAAPNRDPEDGDRQGARRDQRARPAQHGMVYGVRNVLEPLTSGRGGSPARPGGAGTRGEGADEGGQAPG